MDREPIPVFVFLDENIAYMDEKIAEYFVENLPNEVQKFDLIIFPFPKKWKGQKDFQNVISLKDLIYSQKHIKHCLNKQPSPVFVFLTLDLNFIDDVDYGFENPDPGDNGAERRDEVIEDSDGFILLGKSPVKLFVACGHHKQNAKKKILAKEISDFLSSFLNSRFK